MDGREAYRLARALEGGMAGARRLVAQLLDEVRDLLEESTNWEAVEEVAALLRPGAEFGGEEVRCLIDASVRSRPASPIWPAILQFTLAHEPTAPPAPAPAQIPAPAAAAAPAPVPAPPKAAEGDANGHSALAGLAGGQRRSVHDILAFLESGPCPDGSCPEVLF